MRFAFRGPTLIDLPCYRQHSTENESRIECLLLKENEEGFLKEQTFGLALKVEECVLGRLIHQGAWWRANTVSQPQT